MFIRNSGKPKSYIRGIRYGIYTHGKLFFYCEYYLNHSKDKFPDHCPASQYFVNIFEEQYFSLNLCGKPYTPVANEFTHKLCTNIKIRKMLSLIALSCQI